MILASKAKEACLAGQHDVLFAQIYQDRAQVPYQRSRYAKALSQYIQQYGDGAIEIYSAPGRTEIGGNHTDHQHGVCWLPPSTWTSLPLPAKHRRPSEYSQTSLRLLPSKRTAFLHAEQSAARRRLWCAVFVPVSRL